jgi:hypothetical protein
MDITEYTSLADQVARQTPELAQLDADIAARQPNVDALQAPLDAAKAAAADLLAQCEAKREQIAALPQDDEALPTLQGELQALIESLGTANAATTAAQQALDAPKGDLDALKGRAEPIRAAIAHCQELMAASGLAPSAGDIEALKLNARKAAAILAIDADVDAIYAAVIGNRAVEYALAETDALDFKAAGYTGTVPSSVASWAAAKGWTAQQAADDILATATAWRTAQQAIRAARLVRKEQCRAATDEAGVDAALGAWAAFRGVIRGQLGI